jgi:dipeptidyl aminopeptidase/acylaminoacyl peptidase
MTAETRFDRDLPTILEDLYLGPSPDYRDEVMAAAVRTRQRPSWTFAGRWFPMADIATRSVMAPRVPWRAIGAALVIVALVLTAAALIVGSRQTKVPPPFGLARNGLIAYGADGDIFTVDPVTGRTTSVVTGPEDDFDPVFSPDGTRIAFRRSVSVDGSPGEQLVVVTADGSNPVVATARLDEQPGYAEWAPNSRSLLVEEPNGSAIWMLDAVTPSEPRVIATDATIFPRPFRPPDGNAVLIARSVDGAPQIVLLDLVSGVETVVVQGTPGLELGTARWSADGTKLVYVTQPADAPDTRRLQITDVAGTGAPIAVPGVDANHFDMDPTWSHDGSRIAFVRWIQVQGDEWEVRPIMIYTVADGRVTEVGPLARDVRAQAPNAADALASAGEGLYPEFSPDATTLLAMPSEASGHPVLVDPVTGSWRLLDVVVKPEMASNLWQRNAPQP